MEEWKLMANQKLLQHIVSLKDQNTWEVKCILALNSSTFGWASGLVNKNGAPMTTFNGNTWGIDLQTCYEYCNTNLVPLPVCKLRIIINLGY